MDSNYLNNMLNGYSIEECDAFQAEDRLWEEIEDAASHIAMMKVDDYDIELDIDDIDIDLDEQTAIVKMSNDTMEVQLDYDHKTGDYEVTIL